MFRPWASIAVLGLGLAAFVGAAEPRFYRIQDPVAEALEACADGRVAEADAALQILAEKAPGDADTWVARCLVSQEGGKAQQAKLCRQAVLDLLPREEALQRLKAGRHGLDARKAQIKAAKEARGQIPYNVVTPIPTPDPKIWAQLEKERRQARTTPVSAVESLSEGPRLLRKGEKISK